MQNNKDSFFSMDRLLEFGMGMAMSQQIAQTMNAMMASMRQPPQVQVAAQPLFVQQPVQQGAPAQPVYRQYATVPQPWQSAPQHVSQNPAAAAQVTQQSTVTAPPPLPPPAVPPQFPIVFYIAGGQGTAEGPYSESELARLIIAKKLTAKTPVWKAGTEAWKTAAEFSEIVALAALVPPAMPSQIPATEQS